MKIFTEENIGKLIILNSSLVGLLMWLGIVAHTFWDAEINLKIELAQLEKEHIRQKKEGVTMSVQDFIQSMDVRHHMALSQLKHSLESQVRQIQDMAGNLYEKNRKSMSDEELQRLIIEAVRPFRFNNGRSTFFILTLSGIAKLWPPDVAAEGKSIHDNSNENRLKVFTGLAETARRGGGFYEYSWPKPDGPTDRLHQAVAYVAYFPAFDWYIGTSDYIDDIEGETQQHVINVINQHASRTADEYMFIIDLNAIKGGAPSVLVNPRRPDPLNRLLSSEYQEPEGKRFREEFMAGIQQFGEVFVKYLDKKQGTDKVKPKMTYFKLYPEWKWVIARGFYYDDLEAQISLKKERHQRLFQEKLRISLAIFCFILLGALCISLLFSHKVRDLFHAYRQRLEESNKELTTAMDRAHAATVAKSEFLANMSHEIRTPMNGIINLAELAMETELTEKQRDYLRKIHLSSRSLLEIINDILDFSKIEAGMLDIENISFDLRSLFDKLMLLFGEQSSRKNIRLRLSLPPELPKNIIGDPMRLHQVLSNLISNAVKFTEQGEITVRTTLLQETAERAVIRFSVADTGIGIPAEKLPLLFESFTQADSSTARRYGGTGLGLTISKRLVSLMGGHLTAESEAGIGSNFSFTLDFALHSRKAARNDGSGTDEASAEDIARIRSARILLAEDNLINQQVAQEILAKADVQVETVSNGAEAVAAVAARHFDAVLMDIQMPVMDGYEAARRIRQDLGRTDLPILAMTAHAVSEERDKCFRMGMDDHIPKPVCRSDLFRVLSRWINLPLERQTAGSSLGSPPAEEAVAQPMERLLAEVGTASQPAGLDLAGGLRRLEGNSGLYLKLLRAFCREQSNILEKTEALIAAGDANAAKHAAHSLKGVAGNLGLTGIQALAGKVEIELQSGGAAELARLLRQLAHQVVETVSYLTSRLDAAAAGPAAQKEDAAPKNFSREEALPLLRQLAALVEQSDFSALQFLEENCERIRPHMNRNDFTQLMACIESFSFECALPLLKKQLRKQNNSPPL
ncbi:cache domain-containing protein [Candidatus Electronema sp. TJ]|uniref:cache domain-containing protein n=1 Tax=Candidatus Electronema sp. TJ TaxID=3401573 RepID=UPI003AA81872